jgi:lysine 2,3-aminomutase
LDFRWQENNAVTKLSQLASLVGDLVPGEFLADVELGLRGVPMALRISPYLLALIDWTDPYPDPIRRQFLPVGTQYEPDHPMALLDSLHEREDSPVPGLTHRYPGKALFLSVDFCPVYCRFCTRSYAVGPDTSTLAKVDLGARKHRWESALRYISERPELEDIVVSGGDAYRLRPDQLRGLGHRLLDIPHVRRFRFATKGPAIQPMKILTDEEWVAALAEVAQRGRNMHKEVCLHTHFNHPSEITGITDDALGLLFERGIMVRNQSVLQRGVNDNADILIELCWRLSAINAHPYYVFMHDLVPGAEDLRTSVADAISAEKCVRGTVAGFNTPLFAVDAPGGGGKRDVHSFEHYDRETGISVYIAPSVKPGQLFAYFDPLRDLSPTIQDAWADPRQREQMIEDVLATARRSGSPLITGVRMRRQGSRWPPIPR